MGRKYVLDGAIVKCSVGMKPAKLMVITNQKVKIQGKFKATDTDLLVPQTFFQCKLKPTPSGSFLPCIPMLQKWKNTSKKTNLRGIQKFLYDDSYTTCMPGSRITIVNPMQINAAGAAFEQYACIATTIPGAMPLDGFEEGTLPEDDSSNGFLDGFQTILDIAGLVPGFGEIADGINAVIYTARGDYANAALSVAAMIPIGGQAATAAKLGMKGAKEIAEEGVEKITKEIVETSTEKVVKNSDEVAAKVVKKTEIPSVRNGKFNEWFNDLSPDDFDKVWQNPAMRKKIEARLRHPGGLHEWLLVSRANVFKKWGISADEIKKLRTKIEDVVFKNPPGKHGGPGSTKAHNEMLELIDNASSYDDFVAALKKWADNRLKGGSQALPNGF